MVRLLFARKCGEWLDFPPLKMLGRLGGELVEPEAAELMPLPEGATLTLVPGRHCIGMNEQGEVISLTQNPYNDEPEEIFAVAALLPQGYTRTLLPAITDTGATLPILGYTAVGITEDGVLTVAAIQTDEDGRWNPKYYNTPDLEELVKKRQAEFPQSALIKQLSRCSLEYGCFTAQNIMYRRFEGGIPVSPVCNARCIGCLSLQEEDSGCCSPQNRIAKAPAAADAARIVAAHLKSADYPIVSFGQGCEGEPCLQSDLISEIIRTVREQTKRGTINMNTNAGSFADMQKIIDAGIDSLRVSMISAVAENYAKYHRPVNYGFEDVKRSVRYAKSCGVKVAVNYLAYPGFNDRASELEAMIDFCREYAVDQIQIRNLNIDPKIMTELYGEDEPGLGVPQMLELLKENLPQTVIGNYSYPVQKE